MDNPIRGRTRELTNKVEATVPMNIHNRFDVEVIDSRTGKLRQRAQAENVICTALWTRLFDATQDTRSYFKYIHYGTGTGTPASTDTSLFTFLGYGTPSTSDDVASLDSANSVYSFRRKIQLSETTAVGATLTEVGIGYGTSASTLCTHAMLKDANGNQISIVKTNTDIINIYATVFVHWPSSYNNLSDNIQLLSANYICGYLAGMTGTDSRDIRYYYDVPLYCFPQNGRNSLISNTDKAFTITRNSAGKTISLAMRRFGASDANISGGIGWLLLCQRSSEYRGSEYPSFALKSGAGWNSGTNITGEAIGTGDGTTSDFSTDFDFPSSATIYIDGVAASGVTIDNTPSTTNMRPYFENIRVSNGVAYPSVYSGTIWYNPCYSYGIATITASFAWYVDVSDDLQTWTRINLANGTINVPTALKNYKYWKLSGYETSMVADSLTGKNIHFATPPASGAIITADYHTPTIAKDANHVFDLTVTIQLGEYTP